MEFITIILADDHTLMREVTRGLLEQYPEFRVIGEAEDGQQALELIERVKPDVAIVDIEMAKLNGIEVVRGIKRCCPSTKALMLSAYDDDDNIVALMKAGASGYQLKTTNSKELADAVRIVNAGEIALHPSVAMKIARLWSRGETSAKGETAKQLSARELEVLELAAKGLRNKAAAEALKIKLRTVEGYFNSIFAKLGASSRIEAVALAMSRQLIVMKK
jgi:DNA-binding NarL/FixJ family response regulator